MTFSLACYAPVKVHPPPPPPTKRGLRLLTGDSDNSNSFQHHSDVKNGRKIIFWKGILTVKANDRVGILRDKLVLHQNSLGHHGKPTTFTLTHALALLRTLWCNSIHNWSYWSANHKWPIEGTSKAEDLSAGKNDKRTFMRAFTVLFIHSCWGFRWTDRLIL